MRRSARVAAMRIVAGSRKGHRIDAPAGLATRPTGDRVREAVFNLVGAVEDTTVLDLYAGSGAMGIEALSRGAARAVFVESDRAACRTIDRNLEKLRLTGARVLCAPVEAALRQEVATGRKYDLVLLDPPYDMTDHDPIARHVPRLLAEDGLVVFETSARVEPALPLRMRTSRRYGSARITVFEACE
jgi:16S rRNA (guanine966-N2)-methyltransferase